MMKLVLGLMLLSAAAFSQDNCSEKFEKRHLGLFEAKDALDCYQLESQASTKTSDKAFALAQMSYLNFFIAEYHLEEKGSTLLKAINQADEALLLFGEKYSVANYNKLPSSDKKIVALALYNFGLTTSRYIDIKGQWEAIKRMEDIKRSMTTIIRIKEEDTAFYGAHRTLGIFHIKVPYIAGGRIELAKNFLQTTLDNTSYEKDLSLYPANNVAFAELMFKTEQKVEGCRHLKLVTDLTNDKIIEMGNGLIEETKQSVKDAKRLQTLNKCI